jgi:hypothetical protein
VRRYDSLFYHQLVTPEGTVEALPAPGDRRHRRRHHHQLDGADQTVRLAFRGKGGNAKPWLGLAPQGEPGKGRLVLSVVDLAKVERLL